MDARGGINEQKGERSNRAKKKAQVNSLGYLKLDRKGKKDGVPMYRKITQMGSWIVICCDVAL